MLDEFNMIVGDCGDDGDMAVRSPLKNEDVVGEGGGWTAVFEGIQPLRCGGLKIGVGIAVPSLL